MRSVAEHMVSSFVDSAAMWVTMARCSAIGGTGRKTAYWFSRYKGVRGSVTPLRKVLKDISGADAKIVARNMGWLTWGDVYKAVLRAVIASRQSSASSL